MSSFVRKSLITISAVFVPQGSPPYCPPGDDDSYSTVPPNPPVPTVPPPQPTAAEAVLQFCNMAGVQVTTTIPMTLGSDGITWSCQWDSSAAGAGSVQWVVYASGTVQAANQGQFVILANQPNNF